MTRFGLVLATLMITLIAMLAGAGVALPQTQVESPKSKAPRKANQPAPLIQNERPTQTDPKSGKEMFFLYCASCHGFDGQGDTTAATAFKRPPPDLTLLSRRNSGKYPIARVESVIQGEADVPAHGSRTMPMWGQVFRGMQNDQVIVKLRVHNLAEYVKSIQR
jgi:mono/diheme cytochrome c family protein